MALKIGYWGFRGRVEPIHLLLELTETPYERVTYLMKEKEKWYDEDKVKLGFEYPNLPYLVEGDFKLTQANAIFKYLGKKTGLYACGDAKELGEMEMLWQALEDFKSPFFAVIFFTPDFEKAKQDFFNEKFPESLKKWEKRLADKKWLMGEKLHIGDIYFWNTLDYVETMEPSVFNNSPNVKRFKNDFEKLPQIAKYLASDQFKRHTVFAPYARWGGDQTI